MREPGTGPEPEDARKRAMELGRKAWVIVDAICIDDTAEGYCCRGLGWSDLDLLSIILPALARFEAEVREECAKAICMFCHSGAELRSSSAGVYYHLPQPGWRGDFRDGEIRCAAHSIHAAAALRRGPSRSEEGGE